MFNHEEFSLQLWDLIKKRVVRMKLALHQIYAESEAPYNCRFCAVRMDELGYS